MINIGLQLKYKRLFRLIIIGMLGLTGTIIILFLISRHGAGITPDSVAYISVARNFADSNGFLTFDGSHLVVQPPLYSIMLALVEKTTLIDPQISAGYVNAFLFGFIIFLTGLLLLNHLHSFTLVILGTISILFSYALVQASLMALSEPLFILFSLLFLYYFEKYQTKRDYVSLLVFSVSAALACLTRYVGIVMVFAGTVYLLIWGRDNKEKLKHSIVFLIVAVLPVGIWLVRNYFLSTGLVGMRGASSYTLFENAGLFYNIVASWCFSSNLTGIYFASILLAGAVWVFFDLYKSKSTKKRFIELLGPSLLFILFYSVIILISSTTTAYDPISDRLLSPIYAPLVFILFFIFDKIFLWLKRSFNQKIVLALFVFGIALLIKHPAEKTLRLIEDYQELSGWGFSADSWRKSKTIEFLTSHEHLLKKYTLYSNEPEAIYILTKLNAKRSPLKTFYNSPQNYNIYPDPKDIWLKEENVCLVWFEKDNRDFLFTIEELKKNINMKEVARLDDGEIYTFTNSGLQE
jgi:hypothetical protein